jgi:Ribbon-helix-helix protein, copG family
MGDRITVRLDDELHARLADAAQARGMDVSSVVRQVLMASLDRGRGVTPTIEGSLSDTTVPSPHTTETCMGTVLDSCPADIADQIRASAEWEGRLLQGMLPEVISRGWKAVQQPDTGPLPRIVRVPHLLDTCGRTIVAHCVKKVRTAIDHILTRTNLTLPAVLAALLECAIDDRSLEIAPHGLKDYCEAVVSHCAPAVQQRLADAIARTGVSLMVLLPRVLQVWTDPALHPRVGTPNR